MPVEYKQRITTSSVYGAESNGPCNCCGASFRRMKDYENVPELLLTQNPGILIIDDKTGEPGTVMKENDYSGKFYLETTHVETKQGTLTVQVRYA